MTAPALKHVMIDLETLGTGPDAAIASIGAVAFCPHSDRVAGRPSKDVEAEEQGDAYAYSHLVGTFGFHARVDLAASKSPGIMDFRTVEWWLRQDDDAVEATFAGERVSLEVALVQFREWVGDLIGAPSPLFDERDTGLQLWAKPPTFDEVILRAAFARNGVRFPFHYRQTRDLRTLFAVAAETGLDPAWRDRERAGVAHCAFDDAVNQAVECCRAFQAIRRNKRPASLDEALNSGDGSYKP